MRALLVAVALILFSTPTWAFLEFRANFGGHTSQHIFNSANNTITNNYDLNVASYHADLLLFFWRIGFGVRHGQLGTENVTAESLSTITSRDMILETDHTMALLEFRLGYKEHEGVDGVGAFFGDLLLASQVSGDAHLVFAESGTEKKFRTEEMDSHSVSFLGGMNMNGLMMGFEVGNQWLVFKDLKEDDGTDFGEEVDASSLFMKFHFGFMF